jgi:hypothetical protein
MTSEPPSPTSSAHGKRRCAPKPPAPEIDLTDRRKPMRYLLTVMGDRNYEAGKSAPAALYQAMGKLMEKSLKSGVLVSAGGLKPSSAGARLSARDGRIAVMDGPFTEAKEIVGGYAFIEASSKAEAIKFASQFIDVHIEAGVRDVDVEIREVLPGGPGN